MHQPPCAPAAESACAARAEAADDETCDNYELACDDGDCDGDGDGDVVSEEEAGAGEEGALPRRRLRPDTVPSEWAATIGGRTGRRYVPVGAVIVPMPLTHTVKLALEKSLWLKRTTQPVHRYNAQSHVERPPHLALHVCPVGAAAFDAGAAAGPGGWAAVLPPPLAEVAALLEDGTVEWCSGLRIGDAAAAGGLGANWHLSQKALRNIAAAAPRGAVTDAAATDAAVDVAAKAAPLFRFIELFAGIGGFRFALEPLGGECVWASEIGEEERETYFRNFGTYPAGDITECPSGAVPRHALLTAGFPCQSFCRAGLKTGFNDARGELFFEVVRMARRHQPAALLLENVPHLARIDDGAALRTILEELRCLGYHCHHRVVASRNVVPQERNRLYIVCFRDAAFHARFQWPARLTTPAAEVQPPPPTLRGVLQANGTFAASDVSVSDAAWEKIKARGWTSSGPRLADRDGSARTIIASYKNAHSRFAEFVGDEAETRAVKLDPTGKTQLSRAPRFFTTRECARIQGFPESFVIDYGQPYPNKLYHQIGNAVSPATVRLIGQAIVDTGVFAAAAPL